MTRDIAKARRDRKANEQAGRGAIRRMLTAVVVALVVLYLVGGVSGIRRLRARYAVWTQPPTAAEVARAGPDTAPTLPKMPTHTADGRKIPLSETATVGEASWIIGGVMIVAVVLMFATARDRPTA
ncbi:MAG TPA: hypothetical protein VIV65_08785 [Gemmatimonadaceae bacterium]|jgi:hypothetical protein